MERTLAIIKPGAVKRLLIGEIITRFERKSLRIVALKMMQLSDEILKEHYSHLIEKPFFQGIKDSMQASPVVVCCLQGVDAVRVVRDMTGPTNSRNAAAGTIRGDYSMSVRENIIHTSDSIENAKIELDRFFVASDYCTYKEEDFSSLYAEDEF